MHCSFYFLSFPKGNRSLSLFSPSPFWTETNNRPFPLHSSWCWMSKGGSQRSRNILLESFFESSSPTLSFFLSWILGCCNNSVCVWKKTAHAEQRQFKVTAKWQAGSSGLLNCIVFFLFLHGRRIGEKTKAQLGQKASSVVSGELHSAQTKIAAVFCWQTLFNARVFFCQVGLFLFSYLWQSCHFWIERAAYIYILDLIYCYLKMHEKTEWGLSEFFSLIGRTRSSKREVKYGNILSKIYSQNGLHNAHRQIYLYLHIYLPKISLSHV